MTVEEFAEVIKALMPLPEGGRKLDGGIWPQVIALDSTVKNLNDSLITPGTHRSNIIGDTARNLVFAIYKKYPALNDKAAYFTSYCDSELPNFVKALEMLPELKAEIPEPPEEIAALIAKLETDVPVMAGQQAAYNLQVKLSRLVEVFASAFKDSAMSLQFPVGEDYFGLASVLKKPHSGQSVGVHLQKTTGTIATLIDEFEDLQSKAASIADPALKQTVIHSAASAKAALEEIQAATKHLEWRKIVPMDGPTREPS